MMRKIILCIALLIAAVSGYAAGIDTLYKDFADQPGAEGYKVGKFLLAMAKPLNKSLRGLDLVEMVDLENCSSAVKRQFEERIAQIDTTKYTKAVSENSDGSKTAVYMVIKEEAIREILIVMQGKECGFVYMKGKLKPENLQELQNMNKIGTPE